MFVMMGVINRLGAARRAVWLYHAVFFRHGPGPVRMSERWKLKQSRDQWKQKAIERGATARAQRKEITRLRAERDRLKAVATPVPDTENLPQRGERAPLDGQKAALVHLALSLFVEARLGFRAIARALAVFAAHGGLPKAPCAQTVSHWVTRLSLVKMQTFSELMNASLMPPLAKGYLWMIDLSIGLGSGKILSVLALPLQHHVTHAKAPRLQDVRCVAVAVEDTWNGASIADFLERVIARTGAPSAILKDGGTDLNRAVCLLAERGHPCPAIADVSHVIANLFKHTYGEHPLFSTFVSACGRVSKHLKQTLLASLAPPKVSTKARFMNVHGLVAWADQLLKHSPRGEAAAGSVLARLRASLEELPACKPLIRRFLRDAKAMLACQKVLKHKGLNKATHQACQKLIEVMPASSPIRQGFTQWAENQLAIASALELGTVGLPISTDILESLFGIGKRLGVGQTKDANWIALRLPCFCGTLSRDDSEHVLQISVKEQQALTSGIRSLLAQRRQVLPHPGTLESLAKTSESRSFQMLPTPVAAAA